MTIVLMNVLNLNLGIYLLIVGNHNTKSKNRRT